MIIRNENILYENQRAQKIMTQKLTGERVNGNTSILGTGNCPKGCIF